MQTRPSPQPHLPLKVSDPRSFSALLLCCMPTVSALAHLHQLPSALLCSSSCLSPLSAHTTDLLLFLGGDDKKVNLTESVHVQKKKKKRLFSFSLISLAFCLFNFVTYLLFAWLAWLIITFFIFRRAILCSFLACHICLVKNTWWVTK